MKRSIILSFLLLAAIFSFSQAPGIRWQQTSGNSGDDFSHYMFKTSDNCIILISETAAVPMTYYQGEPDYDILVQKVGLDGILQWKKVVGGSRREDELQYMVNPDGTFMLFCMSLSNDRDVSNNHGAYDLWVCKMDNNGNLVWQNSFGGSGTENPGQIIRSSDGSYIIVGNSHSTDGDITNSHGNNDAWVLKVNDSGQIIWQKSLGGSGHESDFEQRVIEANDGSIYVLTTTPSNDGDVSGNHSLNGDLDIWLVKLNSSGSIIWQKCLGGIGDEHSGHLLIGPSGDVYVTGNARSIELPSFHGTTNGDIYFARVSAGGDLLFQKCYGSTEHDFTESTQSFWVEADGSTVIAGTVQGGDGDVTGLHGSPGSSDIWLFKIDNTGNIVWQKTLGGSGDDVVYGDFIYIGGPNFVETEFGFGQIIRTQDNGFLMNAMVSAGDGDINDFHGPPPSQVTPGLDMWLVKLSANGQLEWSNALGGAAYDVPGPLVEIAKNDFIVAGSTKSRDGDIQTISGGYDAWLLRTGPVNRIIGTVFLDNNGNGIKDAGDSVYSEVKINTVKGAETKTFIPFKGRFVIETDTGVYNTSLTTFYPYFAGLPSPHQSNFNTYFNTDSFSFALVPLPGIKDLVIFGVPLTIARPGFPLTYRLNYKNVGPVSVNNVEIKFKKDSRLIIQSAQPVPTSTVGDTLKWNFSILDPQKDGVILLNMTIAPPPTSNVGDTLSSLAIIGPSSGDITPLDDTSRINQRIQGAVDPNNKAENLGGSIAKEQVVAGEYINYFIRFQNTGTDTAFNVVVRDTLDNKLDWSSFQMIASSHPYQLQIDDQNKLIWTFYGINLPDSNVNEPGSHGYLAYRIKADNTLNIGATFLNRGSIYFDFNLPVNTNFAPMIVGTPIALPLKLLEFDAQYQQPNAELNWTTADESNVDKFIIERGTDPIHFAQVGTVAARNGNGVTHYQFKDGLASTSGDKFYYRLRMVDQDNKFTYSNIALVKRNGIVINEVVVNPSPTRSGQIIANINYNRNVQTVLSITDMQGRVLEARQQNLIKGYNVVPLLGMALPAGVYFLQVKAEGKQLVTRFVISQ